MLHTVLFGIMAFSALLPASVAAFAQMRAGSAPARGSGFWLLLGLAAAGPTAWAVAQLGATWRTGLSTTLWVSIAACLVLFVALSALTRSAWRLTPILLPYLAALGLLAVLTSTAATGTALRGGAPWLWLDLHIAVSVGTYALLTLGAVAAVAAFLQDRALKTKRPTPLTRQLPSLAEAERLQARLLGASEAVLGLGLITGMAVLYFETGQVLVLDHKVLLSILAFAVIGLLLAVQAVSGIRGRRATRLVLLSYLLLTLAYPGVKFVTDVLAS